MNILEQAETSLAQGYEDKARALVLRYRLLPGQTAAEYVRWGRLCEDLALPQQAQECYQKALAINEDYPQALWALAQLNYEIGDLYSAKRLIKRLLRKDPEFTGAKDLLGKIYRELGEQGSLAVLTRASRVKAPSGPRYFPPSLGAKDLEPFAPFLEGREAFGEFILNPKTGAPVFLHREQALTPEDLRAHILGQRYLAVYPINQKKKTRVAYLSIRVPQRDIGKHVRERSWLYLKAEATRTQALKALKSLRQEGLPVALERLSPYAYRLWFLFKEPVHFLWAKRFLRAVEERLPYPEEGLLYQPWNLTKPIGVGWREQAVVLPLGQNPVTKKRALFLEDHGEPYADQLSFFKKLRHLSFAEIRAFCRQQELRWEPRTGDQLDALLTRLCKSCPLIENLVHKARAGRRLRREEKIALFLTVGLLDPEGRLLHEVLHPCPDYRYTKVERQRQSLPPNPISCYKLRQWFPGLTSFLPCHCVFNDLGERYPSPLLHVAPILVPAEDERLNLKHHSPVQLARKYWFYFQEKEKIEKRLSNMRKELCAYLKRHPGKRLSLGGGYYLRLRRDKLIIEEA